MPIINVGNTVSLNIVFRYYTTMQSAVSVSYTHLDVYKRQNADNTLLTNIIMVTHAGICDVYSCIHAQLNCSQ